MSRAGVRWLRFTLLSGEPPFSGAHFLAVLQQHAFEAPPLLSDRCDAPDAVTDFLDRMLAKDPAVRPSATEVAETLTYLAAVHDPADDVATPASAPSPGVPSPGALSPQSPSAASPQPAGGESDSTREIPSLPAARPAATLPPAAAAAPLPPATPPPATPRPAAPPSSAPHPTAGTPDASVTGALPAWHRRPGNGNWILLAVAVIVLVAVLAIVYSLGMRQGQEMVDPETPEPTALSLELSRHA